MEYVSARKEEPIMMPEMNAAVFAVSSSPVCPVLVKVTIATALGLIGARLARGSRAAVRHALLAATFGVLLLLPLASVVAPPVRVAVPIAAQAPAVPHPFAGPIGASTRVAPADARAGGAPTSQPGSFSLSTGLLSVLLTVWIAGAMLFLLPMVTSLWQVRSLRCSGIWRGRTGNPSRRLGRRVEGVDRSLPGPMTCGVVHPAIVLPLDAQTWEAEDLNRAIVHELEHVQRRDWVNCCLARAVCAVYWFHPLVWIAWRQLTLEAERACDDAVLGRSEATAYADQLVGLAQRLSKTSKLPLLAMANRSELTKRVGAVLDSRQRREPGGRVRGVGSHTRPRRCWSSPCHPSGWWPRRKPPCRGFQSPRR